MATRRIALTLFSSNTCSLCSVVKTTLDRVHQKVPFTLSTIDIHSPECPKDLAQAYMFDIPVVHLNGQFLLQHRVGEDKLEEALKKYQATGVVERIKT
ncbi:thioredoxin-like protein [Jimgerdemannia flammicorona]|uniref:Glutaredoxin-like protein n=1 Tax=Jimgerdemannia flammicorona TaxID=994334 RepID=A0A433AVR6_9FUNG|nr:thioredoxin-like protein [Jimgerdemannia flammicorona]